MPRLLAIDVFEFLAFLALGAAAFLLGKLNSRWPKLPRFSLIGLAVSLVVLQGLAYLGVLPLEARRIFSLGFSPKVVLTLVALFLLGVTWHAPRRSFTPSFLLFLAGASGFILAIDVSGRLYWRFFRSQAWAQTADAGGGVKQSTLWTCGPAAAAMLLHRFGIDASEGEMAYRCGTSFFGTDGFALADGLNWKLAEHGAWAEYHKTTYDACRRQGAPFIASMRSAGMFAHAIYVERLGEDRITMIDPEDGVRKDLSRQLFEEKWTGEALHIHGL